MRRAIRLVFALIGLAIVASAVGTLVLYLLVSREPAVEQRSTLVLRPGGDLPEVAGGGLGGSFFGGGADSLRGFIDNLRKAKRDPRISGVLLMPSALQAPYWARLQELRDAILDFRTSGKAVVAFLEYGGDREYYLASAADRVFLLPTSPLELTGVASYEMFLRGTLDLLGTYPDFLHIGQYKTATNQLTEKTFTAAHREMASSMNKDTYEQLVHGIASARRKSDAEVRALIDQGPFLPADAVRAGLVDGLAYEDQLDEKVSPPKSAGRGVARIEGSDYRRVSERSVGIRPRSRIAIVYAIGEITSGKGGFDPLNGAVAGSDTVVEQIRRIRDDDSIKAIVVRIDSPGGSSTASDVIWRELMITRDAQPSRPIVTSMSDLAASGGYYIALPAHVIVAEPGTLTGSIGIYGGKMVTSGTMHKVGLNMESVTSGRNAAIESPLAPYTAEQRGKMQGILEDFYRQFLEKVATSRHMTVEQVDALGQGRVWTGQQAKQRGLVDELGGLDTAVAIAKQRAKIPAGEDAELVIYLSRPSLIETIADRFGSRLGGSLGSHNQSLGLWGLTAGVIDRRALAAAAPLRLFRRGEPLALMPYGFFR